MIKYILRPLNSFMRYKNSGGIVLLASVLLALILANSPFGDAFLHFWENRLEISIGDLHLNYTLHHWINDGLMAMFFFVVGLELKREIIAGELSSFRKASLPIAAAIGGMLIPAGIYLVFNQGLISEGGWGIPMATDIVFSLALIGLVSDKVPTAVKVFLVALATVDDLGAVLVIAFFYSSQLSFFNLLLGLLLLAVLITANLGGVRNTYFYAIVGIGGVWLAFLLSGVHATIAGVLVALSIPARTAINEKSYAQRLRDLLNRFDKQIPKKGPLVTPDQHQIIEEVKNASLAAQTPLQKLESALHPWVTFLVIPLFALANAGVVIGADFLEEMLNPVTIGIVLGLVLGKLIGIFSLSWLLVRSGFSSLPKDTTWSHIAGTGLLAGVGFTMSLFITNLAFDDPDLINQAKYGILLGSTIAALLGLFVLKRIK